MVPVIICFFLFAHNAHGAAQPADTAFYIFNATAQSSLYIRLREEKPPHEIFKPTDECMDMLTDEICTLPANACIKVLHNLTKEGRLRLRVWPDSFRPNIYKPIYEPYAFCGKLIPPGGNIFILGYRSEWGETFTNDLRNKGHTVNGERIARERATPSAEHLFALRTESPSIETFKTALKEVINKTYPRSTLYHSPFFETIGELTLPISSIEIMSAVFDMKM